MKHKIIILLILFLGLGSCKKDRVEVDILIKNGTVYNGVDSIPSALTLGLVGDKIAYVGTGKHMDFSANRIIDAEGMIVSPGFIDPHTHADRELKNPKESHNIPFLFQGVTTVVVGNDGSSDYPLAEYEQLYKSNGVGTNVAFLVGQGTIREKVMGNSDREATDVEILKMMELVQQEMDAGALGMSTGLFYAPGSYASTEEVIALAKVVRQNHGIYDTHLRDEGAYSIGLVAAVKEAIEIGEKADLPVHISHIKCLGKQVWKQSDSLITIIEEAQKKGVRVTANQYPYEASATGLKAAVVPRWAESGGKDSLFIRYADARLKPQILHEVAENIVLRGGADKLLIVDSDHKEFEGKTLQEIAQEMGLDANEAVFEILDKGYARVASFSMAPYDIKNFMKQDWVVTSSDGNTGHPRKYGTFPRKYKEYVKSGVINLADYINGSTSRTADILGIPQRGTIQEGYYADVIIFDPETFGDKADYQDPFQLSEGLQYSIINGKISVEKGTYNGQLNGRTIKNE
ncbi:amidohydrolase family protein [Allomuricauda taeanensis]|uniref:N-acyl-D-amino-acid deacylase family protein n=1 Tax=Flagellimonas taeanensis TaxID=1005926 RepID=UPI002E7B6CDA|nr:amidohydrolase family protein [Allomuricauda taeanensis]MEE1963015.1 amidohydrolase family protein [Allomuricauda taeanensis]